MISLREERYARARDFRGPVADLGLSQPVVASIIKAYVQGRIITKEEALSQMVVMLAQQYESLMQKHLAVMRNVPFIIKEKP